MQGAITIMAMALSRMLIKYWNGYSRPRADKETLNLIRALDAYANKHPENEYVS